MAVERSKQIAGRRQRDGADRSVRHPFKDKNIFLFQLVRCLVNEKIPIVNAA
jgi:hypothetical protein